jgi:Recombinase
VQGLVAELLAGPLARLEQLEAHIASNSTSKLTGNETITSNLTPKPTGNDTGDKLTGKHTTEQLTSRAAELREQGLSWAEIARRLNAEGIPTPSGKGKWHDASVVRLVKAAKEEE